MAKKFQFEDENENEKIEQTEEYEQPSHIDELEILKEDVSLETEDFDDDDEDDDEEDLTPMAKKKKKFIWRWWYYVIIGIVVLGIAFMVYIFALSNNDGPVYGTRCEGVVEVNKDLLTAAVDTVKKDNSEVQSITMDIECKQLKVDIVFKDGMDTKKAKSIAEKAVQTLDSLVDKPKEDGKTYSTLFGKIDNVAQYEVNLYLKSANSDDFPIYGTKHTQSDEFAYTLASVKDKDSAQKALDTKKK